MPDPSLDQSNAEAFTRQYKDSLAWCPELDTWLSWKGTHWEPDTDLRNRALAMDLTDQLPNTHRQRARSITGHKAMLDMAKADMVRRHRTLDQRHYLLATPGHVMDLMTGETVDPNPNQGITRVTRGNVNPHADGTDWARFVDECCCGDRELASWLQRAVGYSITGHVGERVMFFIYGPTASGKTVFLNAIVHALGTYADVIQPSVFTAPSLSPDRPNPEVAKLPGVRFAATYEFDERDRLAVATTKNLTGGDVVTAHGKYRHPIKFRPHAKFWAATNNRPEANADPALWDRIVVIPFNNSLPVEARDKGLGDRLKRQAHAIIMWALEGARMWFEDGLRPYPEAVRIAIDDYRVESDPIGDWRHADLARDPGARERVIDLRASYERFEAEHGRTPLNPTAWGRVMTHHYGPVYRSNGVAYRRGVRINGRSDLWGAKPGNPYNVSDGNTPDTLHSPPVQETTQPCNEREDEKC